MRFLRIFFSRTILVIFSILLQLALLFYLILKPSNYYIFQSVGLILCFFVLINMLSKNQCPEFKLPWLLIIIVFPLAGTVLYFLLANRKLSFKQERLLSRVRKNSSLTKNATKENPSLKKQFKEDFPLEQYLISTTNTFAHANNKITYFSSGDEFFSQLKTQLSKAQKFIFMEYFIIANGIVWEEIHSILKEKTRQGVDVRILYDDIGSLGRVKTKFYKLLQKEKINCIKFNPFKPILTGIHNNRDHRKITVIDGKIAFTGGINIADEYAGISKPLGEWKDSAIMIEGSAVTDVTRTFLENFDYSSKTTSNYERYLNQPHKSYQEKGLIHFFGDAPKPFESEFIGENNYINIINNAKRYVYITTPYLIVDYSFLQALKNASLKGVDVRIITPSIPDKKIVFNVTRSHYKHLLQKGVKIYEYSPGFIHSKTLICDGKIAFVGTINLDYRSFAHHFECGALLYKTPCIKEIKNDFDEIFSKSKQITKETFRMNKLASLLNSILAIFFPVL